MTSVQTMAAQIAASRSSRPLEYQAEMEAVQVRRAKAVASIPERYQETWLPLIEQNAKEGSRMTHLRWGDDDPSDIPAIAAAGEKYLTDLGYRVCRDEKPGEPLNDGSEFHDEPSTERRFRVIIPAL